jgi:5-formyltetrahydrofolate cyclo-ligase
MNDSRASLRARMQARRDDLDARQRIAAAAGAVRSLQQLPEFLTDPNVAGYWAMRGELPLNLAVASLRRNGQHYFLPVLGNAGRLHFAEYVEGTGLHGNRFGIPEPDAEAGSWHDAGDMDVILLPLLAFDRRGHRLGTGGGWYDRSLAFLRDAGRPSRPLLVGVGYAFQERQAISTESWDIDLDYVATDVELIACHPTEPDR